MAWHQSADGSNSGASQQCQASEEMRGDSGRAVACEYSYGAQHDLQDEDTSGKDGWADRCRRVRIRSASSMVARTRTVANAAM